MVRSSMISMGAASAPALSSRARSRASSVLSRPVIWKLEANCSRMRAALITSSTVFFTLTGSPSSMRVDTLFSMNTTAMRLPTLFLVKLFMIRPPRASRRMFTMGLPSRVSIPDLAKVMWSPVRITRFFSRMGRPSR